MGHNSDASRERFRAIDKVRLVQPHEEGTAAADLPPGVYGFTGSPGLAAPLFATKRYRNFEIHRRQDGAAIVGFVSPHDATRLAHGGEPIDITVYADPEGEATELVAINYADIAQHRQYSVRNTAGLSLRVRPQMTVFAQPAPQQQTDPRLAT